ncbi:hypothetical protein QBC44DRAFT_308170 [Cladorrhinum sp. PSN332]|nr:hypothetical protein QBC44DRAFT_308170 [Cladorrhinum sp. PSN332]
MGRQKEKTRKAGLGVANAKERHKKGVRRGNDLDWKAPLPPGLVARPDMPRVSSKHKSWFEFVENKDKKKKLEIQIMESREPPPGYEFVPIGNPTLTTMCKEISRERGAMIFIVTSRLGVFSQRLSLHLNRVGHHIREAIVEEARKSLGDSNLIGDAALLGLPEPIPERQEEINAQADAAIRDLFPRIPNTDRQMIIEHAFNKSKVTNPDSPPVGLAEHLTLSRRVQLAVLAHIRHTHTRYDQLLKETSYVNARKAVESLCLDFLVKWRGDEETGRDQLDEILCEVIVISDSESSDSDSDDDEGDSDDDSDDDTDDDDKSSGVAPADNDRGELGRVNVPTTPLLPDPARILADLRSGMGRSGAPEGSLLPSSPRGNASTRDGVPGRICALSRPVLPSAAQFSHALDTSHHHGDESPRAVQHRVRKSNRRDREKKEAKWAKRGFGRYQAVRDEAWNQAVERQRLGQNGPARAATQAPMPTGRSASHAPQPWRPGYSQHTESGVLVMTSSPREPPHHTRHQSFGTPLNQVTDFTGARNHVAFGDNQRRTPLETAYRAPQGSHSNGVGPIVGSQFHAVREFERAPHHAQRSEDQPLQSIEPASPSGHTGWRQPAETNVGSGSGPVRVAYRAVVPIDRPRDAREYHTYGNNEGFIQLPPRPEPRRMSMAATLHAAPQSPTYSPTAYNTSQGRRDGPAIPRTESHPILIDDDRPILRSAAHPIYISDSVPSNRQSPGQQSLPRSHLQEQVGLPVRTLRRTHRIQPGQGEVYEAGYHDRRNNPPVMDRLPDGAQILRVENKFPKQYGSNPMPPDHRRTQLSYNSPPLREPQDVPTHPRRTEQVVVRYERPVILPANGMTDHREPERHRTQAQRQERVVGYQVVHQNRPGHETVSYTDQHGRFIRTEQYPSQTASVPPESYPRYENQRVYHRRVDSRGREVIVLDD